MNIDTAISEFFSKWKDGRKSHVGEKLEKLYLGKMTDEVRTEIEGILGYDVGDRDFIITNDDVKHIFDQHGDAKAEITRGNMPLETVSFDVLQDIITQPDMISNGGEGKNGRTALIFEKKMPNGTVIYVQFDNVGRKTIQGRTMYIKKEAIHRR